jgi:uncharacterized membrane protein
MSTYKYGKFTKARVETFSDGVFAIIVTLLVLELKVPHIADHHSVTGLMESLLQLTPKFLAWVISFMMVCVTWLNHHRLFEMFRGINIGLFWMNANLLLWISIIPFPTAMIGDYPDNPFALFFFGAIMTMLGVAFVLIRWYVLRNPELLEEHVSQQALRRGLTRTIIFGPVLYASAALLAWASPYLSFAIYFFVPIYFIFPKATESA